MFGEGVTGADVNAAEQRKLTMQSRYIKHLHVHVVHGQWNFFLG